MLYLNVSSHVLKEWSRTIDLYFSIHLGGFCDDIQSVKMKASGLDKYFEHVFTSETTGSKKPDPLIFKHALKTAGAKAKTSVMIGDNLKADVHGAINAGLQAIYYNPNDIVKSEVTICDGN